VSIVHFQFQTCILLSWMVSMRHKGMIFPVKGGLISKVAIVINCCFQQSEMLNIMITPLSTSGR